MRLSVRLVAAATTAGMLGVVNADGLPTSTKTPRTVSDRRGVSVWCTHVQA